MVEQISAKEIAVQSATDSQHDSVHAALLKDASTPMPSTVEKGAAPSESDSESVAKKLGREALLMGGTIGESIVNGLYHLPEKIPQLGESLAIGAGLNALSQLGTPGRVAAWVAGAALTTRFLVNTYNDKERWSQAADAVTDTWNSNLHLRKNIDKLSNSAGSFAFDTATFAGASYLGYSNPTLGNGIISVLRLPVPTIPLAPIAVPGMILGAAPRVTKFGIDNNNDSGKKDSSEGSTPGIQFKFSANFGKMHIDNFGKITYDK